MLRKCLKCGTEYEGRPDSTLCPSCAAKSKKSVIRTRICRQCGAEFPGGPRAWYCPECRAERQKASNRSHRKYGTARPIGSTDFCQVCGKPYTVASGRQKYCPACAADAVRRIDREQSLRWNRENIDINVQREQRHQAAAEVHCVICGKLYIPGPGGQLTCSPECAAELRRRSSARWEEDHRESRNEYHKNLIAKKLAAMDPDERRAYQDKVNARNRENYAKRKGRQA